MNVNQNKNNSSTEGEIYEAQLYTNNDKELIDFHKEPVVEDGLNTAKELTPVLIDDVLKYVISYLPGGILN